MKHTAGSGTTDQRPTREALEREIKAAFILEAERRAEAVRLFDERQAAIARRERRFWGVCIFLAGVFLSVWLLS